MMNKKMTFKTARLLALCLLIALLAGCSLSGKPADNGQTSLLSDPFTEEEYQNHRLPVKISALPNEEQLEKDLASGTVYMEYWFEDGADGKTGAEYYAFYDMPALDGSAYGNSSGVLFRGNVKLEAENLFQRSTDLMTVPSFFTIGDAGCYGLFEKEVAGLSYGETNETPEGHYAVWRTTVGEATTSYYIYTDGRVLKKEGDKSAALSEENLSPECAAYFYGRSLNYGGFYPEGQTTPLVSDLTKEPRFYVQRNGENTLLTAGQTQDLLKALNCRQEDRYRVGIVTLHGIGQSESKKELFRFASADGGSDEGSEPPKNDAAWYRLYDDGSVERIMSRGGYGTERPFHAVLYKTVRWVFVNNCPPEEALKAIS